MTNPHLAIYLNDHLAGATAAIQLLESLESSQAATPLEKFAAGLRMEIESDIGKLRALMERLEVAESPTRKATAWIAGKATALKLLVDDPADGALRVFEALEALSLGIEGKRGLWRALDAAAEGSRGLRVVDYDRLIKRAEAQRRRVEAKRLEFGVAALAK